MLTFLTQYTVGIVAVFFCGRLGKVELDAVALSNSLINVAGLSIPMGLASACDTLFSQIYGSKNKTLAGVVLQRSILIILLATLPLLAFHLNAQRILIALGQDPDISELTGEYLLIFIPALVSFTTFSAVTKYLQNQKILFPSMIVGIVSNATNAGLHYLLIYHLGYGLNGSALAQAVSYILMVILNLCYLVFSGVYKETWRGWTWECLEDWGQYISLALFGMLMICIEWWSFEVGIILTGIKGATELGAQTIMAQFDTLYYMFPLGFSISASVCIGTYLGQGNAEAAKTTARVAQCTALMIGAVFSLLFGLGSDILPTAITNVEEVIELASKVLPMFSIFCLFEAMVCCSGGIIRGLGRQYVGAGTVTMGYAIGLSVGIPLLFKTYLSVAGFWIGMATGLVIVSTIYVIFISSRNWEYEVKLAKIRAKESEELYDEDEENKADEATGLVAKRKKSSISKRKKSLIYEHHVYESAPKGLIMKRLSLFAVSLSVVGFGLVMRYVYPPFNHEEILQMMAGRNATDVLDGLG